MVRDGKREISEIFRITVYVKERYRKRQRE